MLDRKHLIPLCPEENDGKLNNIYKLKIYPSDYNPKNDGNNDLDIDTYYKTPIGVSKTVNAERDTSDDYYINPTEKNSCNTIRKIRDIREDDNNGLMKYLMMSIAIKNNIENRYSLATGDEYFISSLVDWSKGSCFAEIENTAQSFDAPISHLYMSNGPTTIYGVIRGVEIRYTVYHDRYLNTYFHILPPDVFKYTDIYDVLDSVEIRHTHKNKDGEYPTVKYYDYKTDESKPEDRDITESLTTEINNMNLIK